MIRRRAFLRAGVASAIASMIPLGGLETAFAVPVVDAGGIAQVVVQWGEVLIQIQTTQRQVDALRAAARQLDPRSYQSVRSLLNGNSLHFETLLYDIQSMGYTIDRVNNRFRQLFPDEAALRNKRPSELEATSRQMNREIYSAALVAARTQSTLRTIEDNNTEARNILSRSEGNGSQVAQLQSALQMLALIHQNLVGITQMVSASGRVTSNTAVRAVTERRMQRERVTRSMRDYSTNQPIPQLDPRFLKAW